MGAEMKTEAQVDEIMQAMPEGCRTRWCGAEQGDCACLGCVQIGNRAVIAEKITGEKFRGDPEYIDQRKLQSHGDVYTNNKLTRAEWDAWLLRNPQVVRAGSTRSGKTTFFSTIVKETLSGSGGPKGTIEL